MQNTVSTQAKREWFRHDYGVSCHKADYSGYHYVRASAIVAEYEDRGMVIPEALRDICERGIRYSNQDFDVLSAAMHTLYRLDHSVWARLAGVN